MPRIAPDDINVGDKELHKLVNHIEDKLRFADGFRRTLVERFHKIDTELSGYVKHTREDQQRERDNEKGEGPKVTTTNPQIALIQIDELVTFLTEMISSEGKLYRALAPKDKQETARGFAALFNKHATEFKHFRAYAKFYQSVLKYNVAGVFIDWTKEDGLAPNVSADGRVSFSYGTVRQGNKLIPLDMYNVLWDISVPIDEVPERGEFFAIMEMHTPFRLHKMIKDKEITDLNKQLTNQSQFQRKYFIEKPSTRNDQSGIDSVGGGAGQDDWLKVLSKGEFYEGQYATEMVHFIGWIEPKAFGLSSSKDLEIWRITFVSGVGIVAAKPLKNSHGRLPVAFATVVDDELGLDTRSWGERLIPMQRMFAHRMNTYQLGLRKSLERVVAYDEEKAPAFKDASAVAGRVPINTRGSDRAIRDFFAVVDDSDLTPTAMTEMSNILELMQRILPTNISNQIADLQRATMYQSAQLVNSTNRKNHKIGKLIDSTAGAQIRMQMFYNTIQFGEAMEIITEDGSKIQVNPSEFVRDEIYFDVSDGLKGIDKLLLAESLKEIINMLLQSKIANEQIDVVQIIDYLMSLMGDATDFTAFRYETPFDALALEEKQMAFQLLQQVMQQQEGNTNGSAVQPPALPATPSTQ